MKDLIKKEKTNFFKEKPKKKEDFSDKALKLAGTGLLIAGGIAVLDSVLD